MNPPNLKNHLSETGYINRLLLAVLGVQVLFAILFRFWPETEIENDLYLSDPPSHNVLIDEVQITQQRSSPPPPPKPRVPQPIPSEIVIDFEPDFEMEMDMPDLPDLEPGTGTATEGDEASIVSNPQVPPTVVRIVEASTPEDVPPELKGNIEMIVNFLVDKEGRVEEASIEEIRRYNEDGEYEELPFIEYGLMEAVLRAALQWRFRPARQDGEPVRAYTRQRFNY
ncbi:MAG: hypothetical protein R6V27_09705 [Balneolaceae bacterium]